MAGSPRIPPTPPEAPVESPFFYSGRQASKKRKNGRRLMQQVGGERTDMNNKTNKKTRLGD